VVDEAALADAVRAKAIKAGLDVYAAQPGTPEGEFNPPVAAPPGVYGTHHCGASTDQAQQAVAEETVRIVRVFKETGRFENCVNAGEIR
jgi:Lactate dehydrogenase and related dehydrogenases